MWLIYIYIIYMLYLDVILQYHEHAWIKNFNTNYFTPKETPEEFESKVMFRGMSIIRMVDEY